MWRHMSPVCQRAAAAGTRHHTQTDTLTGRAPGTRRRSRGHSPVSGSMNRTALWTAERTSVRECQRNTVRTYNVGYCRRAVGGCSRKILLDSQRWRSRHYHRRWWGTVSVYSQVKQNTTAGLAPSSSQTEKVITVCLLYVIIIIICLLYLLGVLFDLRTSIEIAQGARQLCLSQTASRLWLLGKF